VNESLTLPTSSGFTIAVVIIPKMNGLTPKPARIIPVALPLSSFPNHSQAQRIGVQKSKPQPMA